MTNEQKMNFLYEWCAQSSMVVQELRSMNQMLLDKIIQIGATVASTNPPPS